MANGIRKGELRQDINRFGRWFDHEAVSAAVRRQFPAMGSRIMDLKYWGVSEAVYRALVQHYGAHQGEYLAERRDCDDFAGVVKYRAAFDFGLNGVGFVNDYRAQHAYCALLVSEGPDQCRIVLLEPQTGRMFTDTDPHHQMSAGVITW